MEQNKAEDQSVSVPTKNSMPNEPEGDAVKESVQMAAAHQTDAPANELLSQNQDDPSGNLIITGQESENIPSESNDLSTGYPLNEDSTLQIHEPVFTNTFSESEAVAEAKAAAEAGPVKKPIGKRISRSLAQGNMGQPDFYGASSHSEKKTRRNTPKTFVELLNTDFLEEGEDPDQEFIPNVSPIVESANQHKLIEPEEPEEDFEDEYDEEDDDIVIDPEATLVDDYDYDEYEDKKRFLLSDYKKIEEYLEAQSLQGFHFTRLDGKKYYFYKGRPHNYYYQILYFAQEPEQEQWDAWQNEGWQNISQSESRHKKDAGWYIVRNELQPGELKKEIDNEEEKYRYFKKFSSSCRSTMFLLFVVMACCAVTAWLQYEFKGFIAVIIMSLVLFVIALYIFLVYARMLSKSRKQADLLAARIRLKENDPEWQKLQHPDRSDEELNEDWKGLDEKDNTL